MYFEGGGGAGIAEDLGKIDIRIRNGFWLVIIESKYFNAILPSADSKLYTF
jgi:hypothetical protein